VATTHTTFTLNSEMRPLVNSNRSMWNLWQEVLRRTGRLRSFHCNFSTGTSRKKTLPCMHKEVSKTIQFGRLQCWHYWQEWSVKYTVVMESDGMTYVPSLMEIDYGIQVILRLLPRQPERLQCLYYYREGSMIDAVEMTQDGMTHTY
jgi:hypothetical protein